MNSLVPLLAILVACGASILGNPVLAQGIDLARAKTALAAERAGPSQFCAPNFEIIVYTKAGGLIDATARKVGQSLEPGLGCPVVIRNVPGGKGLTALNRFIGQAVAPNQILAVTNSLITQVTGLNKADLITDNFRVLAIIARDYEAIIVRADSNFASLADLMQANKAHKLIWSGPAAGGIDHLFAQQIWKLTGSYGVWLPFSSGKQAMIALMGGSADVYIGNYADQAGFSALRVLASTDPAVKTYSPQTDFISAVPALKPLESNVLWRGFLIPKGYSSSAEKELTKILSVALLQPGWQNFLHENQIVPEVIIGERASSLLNAAIVARTSASPAKRLQKDWLSYYHYAVLGVLLILTGLVLVRRDGRARIGVAYRFLAISLSYIFLLLTPLNFYLSTVLYVVFAGFNFKLGAARIGMILFLFFLVYRLLFNLLLGVEI